MRIPRRLLAWPIVMAACLPVMTSAQTNYALLPVLSSSEEAKGLRLRIDFINRHWATAVWSVTPDGVDVYRRTMGFECSAIERINPEPLPWTWHDAPSFGSSMTIEFIDTTSRAGTAYEYLIRSVPPIAENSDVVVGHATRGEALIGHGDIV